MKTTGNAHTEAALEANRDELTQTIRATTAKLTLESAEADLIDRIQCMAVRDQVAAMVDRYSAMLEDVELALRALSDGSYGICKMCEEPVAAKRLETIPWASYCLPCQERLENGRIESRGHRFDQRSPAFRFQAES